LRAEKHIKPLTLNAFILSKWTKWILRSVKAGYKLGAVFDAEFTISNSTRLRATRFGGQATIIPRSVPRIICCFA
jgi:hypothetical protein